MDRQYLQQRKACWYARVRVPPSLQPITGKGHILKSLKTRDLSEARRLRWPVVASIKQALDTLRQQHDAGILSGLMGEAQQVRQQLKLGTIDPETAETVWGITLDRHLERYPTDPETGEPVTDPETTEAIRAAGKVALKADLLPLSEVLRDYTAEIASRVRKQTLETRRKRLHAFRTWLKGDIELQAISRAKAGRYVTEVLMQQGLAGKTVRDTLSDLSAFFNWAVRRGMLDTNPFLGQSASVRDTKRGTREKSQARRRAWTAQELTKLLGSAEPSSDVWTMSVLALYTGMRSNEIAEVQLTDIHGTTHIHLPEGKTESSVRDVPIHPLIRLLVAKLKKASTDGYLVSGLKRGGYDQKRHHEFAKKFSRYRRKLGMDDPGMVFHSLRKNFSGALENAGVAENVAQQILGHKKQSLTYGLYSHGVGLKVLKEAVGKVSYGKIDAAVKRRVEKM